MRIYEISEDGTDEPVCRAAVETDTENRLVDTVGKERVGRMERAAWKHIHYHT